jgi:NAD(P)-dependent dehydrogenase (short-subunit alcohol dehydrogenase family)
MKTIFITGGTTGLGWALALPLLPYYHAPGIARLCASKYLIILVGFNNCDTNS